MTARTTEEWEAHAGAQVRTLRLRHGLAQSSLAELASVSVGTVQNLEAGRGSSLTTLIRVLRALDRADWFEAIAPPQPISPMQVLREREASNQAVRQRATKRPAR